MRKGNASIYKTGANRLTIRFSAAEKISLRLPSGIYDIADLALCSDKQLTQIILKQSLGIINEFGTILNWLDLFKIMF